ncbi:GNAT family N-acetyltransferase [Candidatus Palauibacter sp.]|uniref:GNAT family N-acetyltransferase n=1 Tax=Candidatus Palauibacter sp. TaxID=3101350 RepID=UPI003B01D587
MSEGGVVRRAELGDIEGLVAMWTRYMRVHALNPAYRRIRSDALHTRRGLFRRHIEEATSAVFVLEAEDGGLDGMIVCFVEENEPLFDPPRYVRIQTPFVRREVRRRGYLRRLLQATFEWALEWDITEVRLFTGADNLVANAVADELGFEAIEVVRRYPLRPEATTNWEDQES